MTDAAARAETRTRGLGRVVSRLQLAERGLDSRYVQAQCAAGRWQVRGVAVIRHNHAVTRREQWLIGRLNCGPAAALTAFTGLEAWGLRGWRRDSIHVIAPRGAAQPRPCGLRIELHRTPRWSQLSRVGAVQDPAGPALIAAASMDSSRWACGLLAAVVQQKLTTAAELRRELVLAPRLRHLATLRCALDDIEGGSQALSEIDFYCLCRRHRLPLPERQTVRRERSGRRRYLDATWRRADGRLVVVEIDGALHLAVRQWWDDQDRQNELSIDNALVLRFPSIIFYTDEVRVVGQLRRALQL